MRFASLAVGPIETFPKIEEALRREAAKMGADAVIIGFQGQLPMGFSVQGFPGAAAARREVRRVVVGTAIKFGMD